MMNRFAVLGVIFVLLAFVPVSSTTDCASAPSEWIFCEDFSSDNWAQKWQEVSSSHLKVRDTSEFVIGGASLRQEFPPGSHGAGWMHYWWDAPVNQGPVYLRFYVKYDDNFNFGTGDMKMAGLRGMQPSVRYPPGAGIVPDGSHFGTRVNMQNWPQSGAPALQPFLYSYHMDQSSGYGDHFHQNQEARVVFEQGVWYCVEMMLAPNTPGLSDGSLRMWIDDALVVVQSNMRHRNSDDVQIKNLFHSSRLGGPTHTSTQYRWDDGIVVSTERIGCASTIPDIPQEPDNEVASDVNGDGVVNINDLWFVVSYLGVDDFDIRADVNRDGVVNIFDLVLVARDFGLVVDDTPPAPSVTLTASPTSINQGSSSTLTWSSPDATSCTASGAWSGNRATSGSSSVSPSQTSTYTISCSNSGGSTQASTTVSVSVPPPSEGVEPFYSQDFSGFSSVSEFFDSIPHRGWVGNEGRFELTNDPNPSGVGGQVMQFNFPDANHLGGSGRTGWCAGPSVGFAYDIRPLVGDSQKELWAEYWVKYSDNWDTAPLPEWGCTGNPDHKLFFANVQGASNIGRFAILMGNGPSYGYSIEAPGNPQRLISTGGGVAGSADNYFNNQWFRVRMHSKISSDSQTTDGHARVWLNDVLLDDSGPRSDDATRIWSVTLGANRNHGAYEDMSFSVAQFRLWDEDPGWE